MAQPFNRGAVLSPPGTLDPELGEFWSDDSWALFHSNNLSSFERNRMYLNHRGEDFMEISYLSGADSDGDGRSVVAADFRNTGQMDLLVRQVGGGSIKLYENRFPKRAFLNVSLRGTDSNSLGIGARVTAQIGERQLVREMYPANTYRSQSPARLHFGLDQATEVKQLEIRWPSGKVQKIDTIKAGQHILVTEGKSDYQTLPTK